jgi:LmbE family N-acetylglucosaminyl deacetylase
LAFLVLLSPPAGAARASDGPPPVLDAAHLHIALEKLTVVGSALYVAAHPDDENTAMLTWLENEKLVRAGYLSLTRGDGGQNLIGSEQGDLLGVIRTQELLAARRIDGAEQFFARAMDFGYSKGPDETLEEWGREEALSDIVRVIRTFQPDIVIMRFPTTGEGRHGHHTASALLAVEAFEAAGDPNRFPDQLGELAPWKPKRLLWNYFSWAQPPSGEAAATAVSIDLGAYNALLARSYTELAGESRSMHKSQGFGSAERRGRSPNYFKLIAGEPTTGDLFQGVNLSWSRIPGGDEVGTLLLSAHREHDVNDPAASLPRLLAARDALERLRATAAGRTHGVLLRHKSRELDDVIRSCAGLWLEAVSTRHTYAPGDSITIAATIVNRCAAPARLRAVAAPALGIDSRRDSLLAENIPVTVALKSVVPSTLDWRFTQPYWLLEPSRGGQHSVGDQHLIGSPENGPLTVEFEIEVSGHRIRFATPALYRWVDRVRGEIYRPAAFAPEMTLALDQKTYLFPDDAPRPVKLRLDAHKTVQGEARLSLPQGWRSEPASHDIALAAGASREVLFLVQPGSGDGSVRAEFVADGRMNTRGMVIVDHPHIPVQTVYPEASSRVLRLDLARTGDRVGYVMGPGDDVPSALAQAGYKVTMLDDEALASGELSGYDAVVVGVRAYNSREALKSNSTRLLDYVRAGGTLVVQYNTADGTLDPDLAPYPLKLGRDRVTVEEAPVAFADGSSPLLTTPNRITEADFRGWVQERGLYFAQEWAPEYNAVLSSSDPGEEPLAGGLLAARCGEGVFIYTGYAFFRQLPAGVPGAYRLFVNLVSAR